MTRPCAVYRFYDELGSLLYVGIAHDPRTREANHRRKTWWPLVRGRHVEWMSDRHAAHVAEKAAIETETPRFNIAKGFIPPITPKLPRPSPPRRSGPDGGLYVVGAAEIATMLQVSRQRVQQLTAEDHFPRPLVKLIAGKVWLGREVESWAKEHGRKIHT